VFWNRTQHSLASTDNHYSKWIHKHNNYNLSSLGIRQCLSNCERRVTHDAPRLAYTHRLGRNYLRHVWCTLSKARHDYLPLAWHTHRPWREHVLVKFQNSVMFFRFGLILQTSSKSRDSSVGIVTRLQTGWPCPERLWGPPNLLPNGYQRFFPWGVKRPGREVDHSPPSSAEVKNACKYTSTPPIGLHRVMLVTHRDNFTFTNRFLSYAKLYCISGAETCF
jgi:hypothetical protein